jgi:hypothetical protein
MSSNDTSPAGPDPNPSRAALSVLGAILATLLALAAFVVIGMIVRPLAVGVQGIGLCAARRD